MKADERHKRNIAAIQHIVHDWANLVQAGQMTGEPHPFPINHFIQHSFLMQCRKFKDFFKNNRGLKKDGMISSEFVSKTFEPKLAVWTHWHKHMNCQLMHLSYKRVNNKTPWDGSANAPLLKELLVFGLSL